MNNDLQVVNDVIYNSPWRNAYWFARMLLNTDQYGAIGKKEDFLYTLVGKLESILDCTALSNDEKLAVCHETLLKEIRNSARPSTKAFGTAENFAIALDNEIKSLSDIIVFVITVRYIVLPANAALRRVPSDDAIFCRETAQSILDTLGKPQVGKAISVWDTLGVRGCLDAESKFYTSSLNFVII